MIYILLLSLFSLLYLCFSTNFYETTEIYVNSQTAFFLVNESVINYATLLEGLYFSPEMQNFEVLPRDFAKESSEFHQKGNFANHFILGILEKNAKWIINIEDH